MNAPHPDPLLDLWQAADYLGYTESAVRRLVRDGVIPVIKLGGSFMDDENALQHVLLDIVPVGKDGHHARAEQTIHTPQDVDVAVDDHHLGTAANSNLRGIRADDTAAEDDDLCRGDAGDAAEQDTHAAVRLFQAVGTGLHRQATSDFRHRCQQGQTAAGLGNGFIGDAQRTAMDQIGTLLGIGRQVQVGIKNLSLTQHRPFARLRFLDLDDHFGLSLIHI